MSSDEVDEISYQIQLGFDQNYCMVAVTALIFYEHITTLSQEIDLIWSRKKTGATIIFLLNRWFTVGMGIAMLLFMPNWTTNTSCEAVNLLLPVFQLALSIIWAGFSALRVYAVGGGSWLLASVTFVLSMVPVGTNLVSDVRMVYTTLFVPSISIVCNDVSLLSLATSTTLLVVTRSCLVASDAIVLLVTWMKTYRIRRDAMNLNMKTSLATSLLRDGTLYFSVLLILNALHLALTLTNVFTDVTYFVTSLSSVIVSRFLLNLRQVPLSDEWDERPSFITSLSQTPHVSDLRFASTVVGNLGAPLDHALSSTILGDPSRIVFASEAGNGSCEYEAETSDGHDLVELEQTSKEAGDPLLVDDHLLVGVESI